MCVLFVLLRASLDLISMFYSFITFYLFIYIKPCPAENDTGEIKVRRRKNRNRRGVICICRLEHLKNRTHCTSRGVTANILPECTPVVVSRGAVAPNFSPPRVSEREETRCICLLLQIDPALFVFKSTIRLNFALQNAAK